MVSDSSFLFDIETPAGFRVHVTHTYWEMLITNKHPSMRGHEMDVRYHGEQISMDF